MDEYEEMLASKRVITVLGIVAEHEEPTINELARKAGIDHCGRYDGEAYHRIRIFIRRISGEK